MGADAIGGLRPALLAQVKACLEAGMRVPVADQQAEAFLARYPTLKSRIIAFDEVADDDREEILQRCRDGLDLSEQKEKRDREDAEVATVYLHLLCWVIRALAVGVGGAYLFGGLHFGPLELVAAILEPAMGINATDVTCEPGALGLICYLAKFTAHLVGTALWVGLIASPMPAIQRRIGVLEAGSEEAYQQIVEEANTPKSVGGLVGISNTKGGLLSSSEATIETTQGFYRVAGLVGGFDRGTPVYLLHDYLLIGDGSCRKQFVVLN